jgi:hypothetical protein|tara:strand:- start:626 stop:1681 length:1056 start_codon:yes stop_codon:yes gene_type:complete
MKKKKNQLINRKRNIRKKVRKKNKKKKFNIKLKSFFYNLNLKSQLKKTINNFTNKFFNFKKIIKERREKQKKIKLRAMEKEKVNAQKKLLQIQEQALKAKEFELKQEERLEKERKKDLQRFIKLEQAELSHEQAEKQKKIQEQLKLEKKIKQFRKREELELKYLEKYVLKQQRDSYTDVQDRIQKIKEKYKTLREQKILDELKERLNKFGIKIDEQDNRETLLEKERLYSEEREKVELALESFFRSAHSLCFQINKRYIPRYLSILRVIDRRFETGEIFIKWDDARDEEWLILIYIKKDEGGDVVVIEDKSDPGRNNIQNFKLSDIFNASDLLVDSLTKLLDRERNKRKAS